MSRVLIGNHFYDLVTSHRFDSGGMFNATAGVIRCEDHFHAFVKDGWGGGKRSKKHATSAEAEADIERLTRDYFG